MKILISGGCGFLGRNLIPALSKAGHRIVCVDRAKGNFPDECSAEFVCADFTSEALPEQLFEGTDAVIHMACSLLPGMSQEKAVQEMGKSYVINEGNGAFYGPKLDFHLKDSIGRTWQCGTIQLDFQLPQRFDIDYIGADGEKHRPIMLHRVVFGSIERFIGILIEHYAGKFPAWIAPVQAKVLPVSDKYNDYARKVAACLEENNIRVEMDNRSEKLGYKIREARMDKVPYMVIVGENEQNKNVVSVRQRDAEAAKQELGEMSLEQLVNVVKEV